MVDLNTISGMQPKKFSVHENVADNFVAPKDVSNGIERVLVLDGRPVVLGNENKIGIIHEDDTPTVRNNRFHVGEIITWKS